MKPWGFSAGQRNVFVFFRCGLGFHWWSRVWLFLTVSVTKCWLWNGVRMWSGALVEQERARCNIVWVAPFCSGDKKRLGWHRLKSLCVWLSGTTKYKTSTANRAGAKTEHPLWTHNWKEKTEKRKKKKRNTGPYWAPKQKLIITPTARGDTS